VSRRRRIKAVVCRTVGSGVAQLAFRSLVPITAKPEVISSPVGLVPTNALVSIKLNISRVVGHSEVIHFIPCATSRATRPRMPPSLTLRRAGLGLLPMYANAIGERHLTKVQTGGKYECYAHTPQTKINFSLASDTRAQYQLQSLFSPSKAATL
jgi:hypothetical protein